MEPLSKSEYLDILAHVGDRFGGAAREALQLLDDPDQRVAMSCDLAHLMVILAAAICQPVYERKRKQRVPSEVVIGSIIKVILRREKIAFEERD